MSRITRTETWKRISAPFRCRYDSGSFYFCQRRKWHKGHHYGIFHSEAHAWGDS